MPFPLAALPARLTDCCALGLRAAALAMLVALAACSGERTAQDDADAMARMLEAARGRTMLVRSNGDEIQTLDPQKAASTSDFAVIGDLFAGLTRYGADGNIEPGLAESWTSSPDGLRWQFRLREGLVFSDGEPLTSEDVVASFQRFLDPRTVSYMASIALALKNADAVFNGKLPPTALGVTAPDRLTVQIELDRPFPLLIELLAHGASTIVPAHVIAQVGDDWVKQRPLVSSGEYVLDEWVFQSSLTVEKNPLYWDAGNVAIPKVRFLPLTDGQAALRRFRSGEIDVLTSVPEQQVRRLVKEFPEGMRIFPYRGTYYYVFNTRVKPFDDVRVRRAINMIVDRDILANVVVTSGAVATYSMVPAGLGGYGPAVRPGYADWPMEQRHAEARRLLAAAGISPQTPLTMDFVYNTSSDHRRLALAVAHMLKPFGLYMQMLNREAAVHFAGMKAADFSLARSGWIADFGSGENFLELFVGWAGDLNYPGYYNPDFEALMREALQQADVGRRNALMRQAEAILVEDGPVLPLYTYVSKTLISPRVQGWVDNLADIHPTRTLRLSDDLPAPEVRS